MRRIRVHVLGHVQGVGFRPFVRRTAIELGLTGHVQNTPDGVRAELEGAAHQLAIFLERLQRDAPAAAEITRLESEPIAAAGSEGFEIRESGDGPAQLGLVPDRALCAACRAELRDPANRRYRYPFISCAECGPRFSMTRSLPYDRERTSMRAFPPCAACQREYDDPRDRRCHVQAISCASCGPALWIADASGRELARAERALSHALDVLAQGGIVAHKGQTGFQLLVAADQEPAVARLRARKRRPHKPLALMVRDLDAAAACIELSPAAARWLCSAEAPIVIAPRRAAADAFIAAAVSGSVAFHGLMLPTTPLHQLLLDARTAPLVVTSGNRSGEPLCRSAAEAFARLGDVADAFLLHELEIVHALDDSVLRIAAGGAVLLRRARGFAPRTLQLSAAGPDVLASGGQLKNSVAVSHGRTVLLSPHVGELDEPATRERHTALLATLPGWIGARPACVASDEHPDYASSASADAWAAARSLPRTRVQHHLAHALAVIAEHQLEGPLLAVTWDGTGLGRDRTIWGGEFFRIEGKQARRIAHLRPFPLLGGDHAARDPRRCALGLLRGSDRELGADPLARAALARLAFEPQQLANLRRLLASDAGHVPCTSVGRLFDGVAALLGLCSHARFEAEAALALEAAALRARPLRAASPDPVLGAESPWVIDFSPMLQHLLARLDAGCGAEPLAFEFHHWLARCILAVSERAGLTDCVLAGGCFQNVCLVETALALLEAEAKRVHVARAYPANDGALALGQLYAAARGIELI